VLEEFAGRPTEIVALIKIAHAGRPAEQCYPSGWPRRRGTSWAPPDRR
jgi:hypothetical protein